jgi:hypothetical protein
MNKKAHLHLQRVRHLAGVAPVVFLVFGAAYFASAATPATLPYFQNYQGITLGASPAENALSSNGASSSTWSVVNDGTGNLVYRNVLTGGKGFSTIQVPTLGAPITANNFEISAVMHGVSLSSPSSVNYTAGLVFLGASNVTAGTVNNLYVADLNLSSNGGGADSGRMRIVEWPNSTTGIIHPSSTITSQPQVPDFSFSGSYLFDIRGSYNSSGTLTTVFTVSSVATPTDHQSYTFTDSSPRTGSYFGFYTSMGGGGGTMTVDFDNLAVVVPVPSSPALLALGAVFVAVRARKNRVLGN